MKLEGIKAPEPGHSTRVQAEGTSIAIFNVDGKLYGIDSRCTHVGGPLDQGRLEGSIVTCPWHGSTFDVQTGAVTRGPAIKPVRSYRVRADGDTLVVEPV